MFQPIHTFDPVLAQRQRQVLHDQKWFTFLHRARIFRHIPFVTFVFASGSMALGGVRKESDFDLIVGVRFGRIFTTRYLLLFISGLLGWRRVSHDHKVSASDQFCFNHFVTERSYRLAPPYGFNWKLLYEALIPLYGSSAQLQKFFDANASWMGETPTVREDLRYRMQKPSVIARGLEWVLGGAVGNALESFLRRVQMRRLKHLRPKAAYQPWFIVSDAELRLHLEVRPGYQ